MIYLGMQGRERRNRSQLEGGRPRWEPGPDPPPGGCELPGLPTDLSRSHGQPHSSTTFYQARAHHHPEPPARTTWAPSPHNLPAFACHFCKLGTKKYYWLLFCSDVIVPPAEESCSCWPERLPRSISAWVGGVIPLPHCRIELKCILPEKNLNTIKW